MNDVYSIAAAKNNCDGSDKKTAAMAALWNGTACVTTQVLGDGKHW